jgi:hypothetical protein
MRKRRIIGRKSPKRHAEAQLFPITGKAARVIQHEMRVSDKTAARIEELQLIPVNVSCDPDDLIRHRILDTD